MSTHLEVRKRFLCVCVCVCAAQRQELAHTVTCLGLVMPNEKQLFTTHLDWTSNCNIDYIVQMCMFKAVSRNFAKGRILKRGGAASLEDNV